MRHFRLLFFLLLLSLVVMAALTALLIQAGLYPQAVFAGLGGMLLCMMIWNLFNRLKILIWTFTKSLEVKDTTVAFDTDTDDPVLSEMLDTFNRLLSLFHSTTLELETRKLYYDRILRIMTHEMGNSLTPIMAISSDISRHPERYDGPRLKESIDLICSQTDGIQRFLKAYHNLTHLPTPEKERITSRDFRLHLSKLIESECQARKMDADIISIITSGCVTLDIDVGLMSQVMMNLLRNSLDAVKDVDEPSITITISSSDSHPFIIVEDNGKGIDPSIRDDLFDPFVTTKPDGSGVGLYISRQIVRQHGGDLRIFSLSTRGVKAIINL